MKKFLFLLIFCLLAENAFAGDIFRSAVKPVPKEPVGNLNVISPTDVATVQYFAEKSLQYILDNYSDRELRELVISYNKAEREAARRNKTVMPEKVDKETLQSRENMAEYLRSFYQYRY